MAVRVTIQHFGSRFVQLRNLKDHSDFVYLFKLASVYKKHDKRTYSVTQKYGMVLSHTLYRADICRRDTVRDVTNGLASRLF